MKSATANRRSFLKTVAVAALSTKVGPEKPRAGERTPVEKTTVPLGIYNEWGRLREVVVGIMPRDFLLPNPCYSIVKYAMPGQLKLVQQNAGKRLSEVAPEILAQSRAQVEALVRVYQKHGVTVFRPRPYTEAEEQFISPGGVPLFVRDPMLVIGANVIETSLMSPFRRKEIFALREILQKRVAADPGARYVSMPHPLPSPFVPNRPEGPGPFLEGGDVFVMGKDILVGNSGLASNKAGIAWLQRFLAPEGYTVHAVPLTEHWLHLDCILAVVRRGLAICDRSGLQNGLPGPIKDWDIIPATSEEAHALGCNTMCLAENVVLIAEEHRRLIKELEKRKAEVVSGFRMDVAAQGGGGIRCASHPLRRDV